jgi:hypothetical protein
LVDAELQVINLFIIMRKIFIVLALFTFSASQLLAQSGVAILTEKVVVQKDQNQTRSSVIIITYPDGTDTSAVINSLTTDDVQHEIDLNKFINIVIKKGYQLIPEVQQMEGSEVREKSTSTTYWRRIYFSKP